MCVLETLNKVECLKIELFYKNNSFDEGKGGGKIFLTEIQYWKRSLEIAVKTLLELPLSLGLLIIDIIMNISFSSTLQLLVASMSLALG